MVIVQEEKRIRGLRPLSVQIGMAASYWPHSFVSQEAQQKSIAGDIEDMLLGIQKYQQHSFSRHDLPLNVIWKKGALTIKALPLHDYVAGRPSVLLVPSLINRAHIFDLMEQRSMLRYFCSQNMNAYLLDWGDSVADEDAATMETVVMERLVPALSFLHEHSGQKIHALGYCMGGTILMGGAYHAQDYLESLTMLAAPWDFHAGGQGLLNCVKFWAPSAFPAIEEKGRLDVDWIQTVFASLDPFMAAKKFSKFLYMEDGSNAEEIFIAVEDWLNDGVALPGEIAQHCIRDWFLKNLPGTGGWILNGEPIIPEEINCRSLIVASDKDRLVEFETAHVLCDQIPNAILVNPACGHIGMIAGQHSVEKVWKPIAQWICDA